MSIAHAVSCISAWDYDFDVCSCSGRLEAKPLPFALRPARSATETLARRLVDIQCAAVTHVVGWMVAKGGRAFSPGSACFLNVLLHASLSRSYKPHAAVLGEFT